MSTARIRRARCLVSYWAGQRVVYQNYLSGKRLETRRSIAPLLDGLEEPLPLASVRQRFEESGLGAAVARVLLEHDILVREGSALDAKEQAVDGWRWGEDARFFHFATRHVDYTFDIQRVRRELAKKARREPPPSPFLDRKGRHISLPSAAAAPLPATDFGTVLASRRTCRAFSRRPVALAAFTAVLRATWGKTGMVERPRLDRRIIKTSPSGGARHPIEVYPIIQRVEGISPGTYHYCVERDDLVLIHRGLRERQMVKLFSGQPWVADAAALFLFTAVLPRSMWKYDHSRAYRVLLLDAGHLGQTLQLAATAAGLAVFTSAALQDEAIERHLGIDGVTEVALYAGAVGKPAR